MSQRRGTTASCREEAGRYIAVAPATPCEMMGVLPRGGGVSRRTESRITKGRGESRLQSEIENLKGDIEKECGRD